MQLTDIVNKTDQTIDIPSIEQEEKPSPATEPTPMTIAIRDAYFCLQALDDRLKWNRRGTRQPRQIYGCLLFAGAALCTLHAFLCDRPEETCSSDYRIAEYYAELLLLLTGAILPCSILLYTCHKELKPLTPEELTAFNRTTQAFLIDEPQVNHPTAQAIRTKLYGLEQPVAFLSATATLTNPVQTLFFKSPLYQPALTQTILTFADTKEVDTLRKHLKKG